MFKICVYNAQDDVFISRSIIESGSFEPDISVLLREFFTIWPNDGTKKTILLDIGANLGIYGLYIAKLGFRVWAIEPQATNLIKVYILQSILDFICFLPYKIIF